MAVDLLRPGLNPRFCGYNLSLPSGQTGQHYARPGNRFWRVLFAAGITPTLRPGGEAGLLELGIGFTNVCPTNDEHLRSTKLRGRLRGRPRP